MRKKNMSKDKKNIVSIFTGVIFLLLLLPLLLKGVQTVQTLLTKAAGVKANIAVDTKLVFEPIKPSWKSFAQGGEESTDMVAPVVAKMAALDPKFIRIDHIFDHFNVVERD